MTAANNSNAGRQEALDRRLQELENLTTTLNAESRSTRSDIEKLTHSFDRFAQQVTDWMRNSGKTNWGWFIGLGALLISIMGLAAAPFLRDLQRVEANVRSLETAAQQTAASRWTQDEQDNFEENLISEIRRLEGLVSSGDTMLHSVLQREIDQIRIVLADRGEWISQRDKESASKNATQDEQLRQLGEYPNRVQQLESELAKHGATIERMDRDQK